MRSLVKYIVARTYKPLLVKYLSSTRTYSWKGITLEIPPEVFHPGFFTSTKVLLNFIKHKNIKENLFLELGAGSGLISIYAVKKGADVTATDINEVAINFLQKNAGQNNVDLNIIHSDIFNSIPVCLFDTIIINPPYYKKQPRSNSDYAWYCGENGEYFQKLFKHLKKYVHGKTEVLMVLCDGCDLQMIKDFAHENFFLLQCVFQRNSIIEKNYIFKIVQRQ
jgi:release factor glutamine methyltransferase